MGGESRKNTRVIQGGFTRLALSFAQETCFFPCESEVQNGSDAKGITLAGTNGKVTTCKHGIADAFDKLGGFQVRQCLAFQI